ncbi:hypothetical protein FJT64_010447 [Amphibalanus amphitrite]|uniref:Uncharacterized protein n=1 Tax=Amphibalanus amphitrite TaxID=1232801 RepID=A0A6A4VE88_AMPAM|nr:hypothetical protein FJT64_010447 [Amphibalanus amphitrite]
MRAALLIGLLAVAGLGTAQPTAEQSADEATQQLPRAAKMGEARADYYAKKYADHPRKSSSSITEKHVIGRPYVTTYEDISEDYSPYLDDGEDIGNSVRGNETARFFGLSTSSQDLQLGLQFTVPFLSIPLGSLMGQYADWSTMLSVNWPSLLALGLTVLLAMVAVPWLVGQLGGTTSGLPSFLNLSNLGKMAGYGRADDGEETTTGLMARLDDTLAQYDIDSTACMQRGVCTYVREAALSVKEGHAESHDLLLEGLVSNSYVNSWLNGTSILEAAEAGRSGANCAATFVKCPLTANSVYLALAKFIGNTV